MEQDKVKKRASRACGFCRTRKVRCIVTSRSGACTNCIYHEKQCARSAIEPRSPGPMWESASTPKSSSNGSLQETGLSPSLDQAPGRTGSMSMPRQEFNNQLSRYRWDVDTGKTPAPMADGVQYYEPSRMSVAEAQSTAFPASQTGLAKPSCHPTYAFLRTPDFQGILPQDLTFLISQSCFIVPQRSALDEFMQQYFQHIHPMLPVLNEADVWRSYNLRALERDDEDKLSILVLQGILFTSCGLVSLETLNTLGFRTHQEAKWAFYRRAKLLYDFGCETSPITKAQGALLLAQSHIIPRPLAGNTPFGSIWLSVAIHFARESNAHRYASKITGGCGSPDDDPERARKHRNTLKRLWWCCIISDRVFPLSSRRDIKITNSNFDFSGCPILGSEDLSDELYASDVYDPVTKLLLAEVLQKYVELCVVLTDVLTVTSALHNYPSLGGTVDRGKLELSRRGLEGWYYAWPKLKSGVEDKSVREGLSASSAASVTLFMSQLEMYYHSARQALCHCEILYQSIEASPYQPIESGDKAEELQSATTRVTECLVELNNSKLTRWLPMTAIGCTAMPLALHLIDAELHRQECEKGPPSTSVALFANHKRSLLSNLSEAMDTYRPRYYIVDWVVTVVGHVVDLARQCLASLPARNGSSPTSWTELLRLMPSSYLRLVITLEMSISLGKLPEESDFPPILRGTAQIGIHLPRAGKELEFGQSSGRVGTRDDDDDDDDDEMREAEAVDVESAGFDFDTATAISPLSGNVLFEAPPSRRQGEPIDTYGEAANSLLVNSIEQYTPLVTVGAFDKSSVGDDEFDEWADRIFGLSSGF